jgi:hypothetical protein
VMDGLEKRCKSLNFFQMHGYFKRRWLADELPVANVQILRRPSLHDVKGLTGDALRWSKTLRARRATNSADPNNSVDEDARDARSENQGQGQGGQTNQGSGSRPDTATVGGFNAMKRAVGSESQDKAFGVDDVERQRSLLSRAVQRARGESGVNSANVRVLDAAAASAVLPFAVR